MKKEELKKLRNEDLISRIESLKQQVKNINKAITRSEEELRTRQKCKSASLYSERCNLPNVHCSYPQCLVFKKTKNIKSNLKKVKVIKCDNKESWYFDRIGETFELIEIQDESYCVAQGNGYLGWISHNNGKLI